jgi:CHAT domain-containing protein
MIIKKYLIVMPTSLLFAVTGLFSFTIPNKIDSNNPQAVSPLPTLISSDENESKFSMEFHQYEYLILNNEISEAVETGLNNLSPGFEKDYLIGLVKKRKREFEDAYKHLMKPLDLLPQLFNYYDELVKLAAITNNLDNLTSRLNEKKETENKYYLYLVGMIELKKGNYEKSVKLLNSILGKGTESKEIYYSIATAHRGLGDYDQGMKALTKAEILMDSSNSFLPKVLNSLGSLFYLSNKYEVAGQYYRKAYDKALQAGNVIEEIKALINLAIIKDLYGEVHEARKYLTNGIKKAEVIENLELIALLHSELGVSYTYTNNIVEAKNNYHDSYELYSLLKNNERLSYLSSNIASIYLQQTNYKYALKYFTRGLKFAGSNKLGQILNIIGIADVYSNESNYSRAIEYYQRAKQIADSIKDVSSIIKINEGLGALFYNINRPYKSLGYFEEARKLADIDAMPFVATELFYKTGTVLESVDSLELARVYFARGITNTIKTSDIYYEIILKTELAHIYYKMGEINKAKTILYPVKVMAEEYGLLQLVGLQELYLGKFFEEEGNHIIAINKYKDAINISRDAGDYNTQIEAYFRLAKILDKKNDVDSAEQWYLTSTGLIDKISFPLLLNQEIQISHFSGFSEIYNSLVEFYLKHNKQIEAFETIEKSRSRNLMLNLDKIKLLSSVEDEEKFSKYIDLKWMISSELYEDSVLDSLKEEVISLKRTFSKNNKALEYTLSKNPWRSVKEIQRNLDDNENIISVFIGEKNIHLFLLTDENISSDNIEIGRDSLISLLEKVAPLYKSDLAKEEIYINQDLFSFNAEASWQLYSTVFKKLLSKIPENETLIFSFPTELLLLPAEFLVTRWREGESSYYYEDKNFLIYNYPISYSPSASIYITQKKKEFDALDQTLLVGNPNVTNDEFTISYRSGLLEDNNFSTRNINLYPLEYSETEIENINNLVSNSVLYLSEQATESNFKLDASGSNIIHLSTHSLLYKNQPLIIFSQQADDIDDGYLEIGEIVKLNLNSDLVVLSSCRSGLGRIDEAEGILGMQKAFFEAGAASIVVSLWDVNDKYTSYFMKEFYNFLIDGFNKPEALRRAKLSFMKKYSPNPYYWSAFVLSGNPSKVKIQQASLFNEFYYLSVIVIIAILLYIFHSKRKPRIN